MIAAQPSLPAPIFVVRLRPAPGSDGIRELRQALKILARRFGLKCLGVTLEPVEASEEASCA